MASGLLRRLLLRQPVHRRAPSTPSQHRAPSPPRPPSAFPPGETRGNAEADVQPLFCSCALVDALARYLDRPWLKSYQPGVPESVEFEPKPVWRLFDDAAARWPSRDALVFYGRGITYA